MKFKLERIENIQVALGELCNMDIISDTSFRLGAFQDRIDAAYKTYNKIVTKLREKYGKWKYKLTKDVVKDEKTVKVTEICTLEGPAGQKYLVDPEGKKVEGHETDWDKVYWEANSDEAGESFRKELTKLQAQELEIKLSPILVSRLVRFVDREEKPINVRPVILATLEGIIIGEETKEDVKPASKEEWIEAMLKLWNALDPEDEEEPVKEEAAA